MGLDMYLYKANKISEEDRKSLTGVLRSNIEQSGKFEDLFCISKSEAFFDGEKIKSGLDAIINFCDEITMKDTFINYEQFLKEYDLPTHYSLLDYGIKGDEEKKEFVFIYLDTINNCNKEVTIPYDEFNEKYIYEDSETFYVCYLEEIGYWRKESQLRRLIHSLLDTDVENMGYYRLDEKIIYHINEYDRRHNYEYKFSCNNGETLFYHEWY